MNQIKCPHCGTVFTINEADYSSIVSQIKDHVFEEELQRREKEIQDKLKIQNDLDASKLQRQFQTEMDQKQKEIDALNHSLKLQETEYEAKIQASREEKKTAVQSASIDLEKQLQEKENELVALKGQIEKNDSEKQLAVQQAIAEVNEKKNSEILNIQKQLDALNHSLKLQETEYEAKIQASIEEKKAAVQSASIDLEKQLHEKENELIALKGQIEKSDTEKQLAVQQAISETNEKKNSEIRDIQKELDTVKNESIVKSETMRTQYDAMVKSKDREIADQKALVEQYKDFKVRLSTKMIGETLEQHCSYEFNKNRMGMFPHAYFEKDNDARTGSKGDFIFRDFDDEGTEIISIMFEMKNENETTSTKHKNEDFLKELDKDRREKKCEYAVLCTMLEADNDLYNEGIVDVSYRYPKMYVIRPQFFIPIITLLRNAAMNALDYKKQLLVEKNNNLDLSNFEDNMNKFKDAFGKNYASASKKFNEAIEEIDKSITHLQKIKDALTSSDRQLRLANDKAQDLTIRKLTKNAPSVKQKLDEVRKQNAE